MTLKCKKVDGLGSRIEKSRKTVKFSRALVAKELNIAISTLQAWESGDREPPASNVVALAELLETSTSFLLHGASNQKNLPSQLDNKSTSNQVLLERDDADAVHVPQYDLTASAGNGSYVVAEHPVASFSFSKEWIAKQGLHNKTLTIVPVRGDSMENTLRDGDLLLVSILSEPQDAREGVCVLRYNDEIFVKRIQYDFKDQGYKITSDNKAYSEFYVEKSDILSDRFKVIGKVERVLQKAIKQEI